MYTRWKCTSKACKNFENGYCYIDGGKHVEFDFVDANTWERAIKKNKATLEAPSDNLLASMIKKNYRLSAAQMISRKQALSTTPSYHTQNHTHFYFGDIEKIARHGRDQARDIDSTIPPTARHTTPTAVAHYNQDPLPSSPIVAESDSEEEVRKYFDDLIKKEKALNFKRMLENAKEKMLENGIKISQIRRLRDDQLEKMEITEIGIQMTIRAGVHDFKTEMKNAKGL